MMLNIFCVGWSQPTAPTVSPPLHLFLSLFWEEGHSLLQSTAAFSAQFPTLGYIDLCSLDLTEFSEEHKANEESVPSSVTALFWGCPRPPEQSWALKAPSPLLGCPSPTQQVPLRMGRGKWVSMDAPGSAPCASTEHMGKKVATETGPVFGNAAEKALLLNPGNFP